MARSILITVVIYYWYSLEITTSTGDRIPVQSKCSSETFLGCSVETIGHDYITHMLEGHWMNDAFRTNLSVKFQFLNEKQDSGKDKFVKSAQTAAENLDANVSWYQTSSTCNSFLYIIAGVLMFDMFAGMSATSLGERQYPSSVSVKHPELEQINDQSTVPDRNKTISQRTSLFHADFGESVCTRGHCLDDVPIVSTVNKLWFAVPNVRNSRKRRRPHFAAFLAYCHNDSDFVINKLYEPLQQYLHRALPNWSPESLTLLYDKHFLPGQSLDEICRAAVYDSYVTIAIVSDSFIQSPWCLYEMENAVAANVPVIPLYLTHRDITCFSGIMKHVYDKHVRTFWPQSVKKSGQMTSEELDVVHNIGFSAATYIQESSVEMAQRIVDPNNNVIPNQNESVTEINNGCYNDQNYDTISNTSLSGHEENDLMKYELIDNNVNDYEEIDDTKDTVLQSTVKRAPKQCCELFAMFRL